MANNGTIWDDVETKPTKLKLNTFKGIYDTCKTPNPVLNFLIFALLFWLEERYIDYKIKMAIDIAEKEFHAAMDELEIDWKEGAVIEEKESSVEGLPEMRIHNPNIDYR
ncbi:MAG: hypothetical protein ACO233_02895 [Candidatus Fonsibacter ubiquis]